MSRKEWACPCNVLPNSYSMYKSIQSYKSCSTLSNSAFFCTFSPSTKPKAPAASPTDKRIKRKFKDVLVLMMKAAVVPKLCQNLKLENAFSTSSLYHDVHAEDSTVFQ